MPLKYFENTHPSCVVIENEPFRSRLPCLLSKGGIQLCGGTKQGLCSIQVSHSPIHAESLHGDKLCHKGTILG